jgi:Protein of unknown function (DUF4238)
MAETPLLDDSRSAHYISECYLKGFMDVNRVLWVYEKFKAPKASKPKDEAQLPDYYSHSEDGPRNDKAEALLGKIESRAAPVLRKLSEPTCVPTLKEMEQIYLFTVAMLVRVPSFRRHLDSIAVNTYREMELRIARDKERFYQVCAEVEADVGKPMNTDYETFRQQVLNDKWEYVQTSNAFNLHAMFVSARSASRCLIEYDYQILYAPKGDFFVTSDSPVFTLQHDGPRHAVMGMGLGHPNVQVYMPLNKRAFLKLGRNLRSTKTIQIPTGHVAELNRLTMNNATICLYAPERSRRTARLFDQWGCKIEPGRNAFMLTPELPKKSAGHR